MFVVYTYNTFKYTFITKNLYESYCVRRITAEWQKHSF
jgi:hypothetical protein